MGLQGQLNDISSDSLPILLIAVIANFVNSLRSFLLTLTLLRFSSDTSSSSSNRTDDLLTGSSSSLILLAEQMNLNRTESYSYCDGANKGISKDCVVCMCGLRDGERVRMLGCRHVFHKECFDGWLHHLNFNCPLCRSTLVKDGCVGVTRREMVTW
ncbi:hypothetical protein ACFE04_018503 [Oxalis oulophora]